MRVDYVLPLSSAVMLGLVAGTLSGCPVTDDNGGDTASDAADTAVVHVAPDTGTVHPDAQNNAPDSTATGPDGSHGGGHDSSAPGPDAPSSGPDASSPGPDAHSGNGMDAATTGHDVISNPPPDTGTSPPPDANSGTDVILPTGTGCARPLFPPNAPWNQRADTMALDSNSAAVVASLQAHGWGAGSMQIDTSIYVQCDANNTAPRMTFNQTGDFYSPDCDPAPMPVPAGGHLEGETGYDCTQGGDCHLIVVRPMENRIYEQWRADFTGGVFNGGCLAIWDTSTAPPASGRGEGCTSADAGGFPISALLFDADEVASGHINHAIRFILPNNIIVRYTYVHPATHATSSSGGANAVPYGAHLRLRSDRLSAVLAALPNQYARTVAQAMHDYGMFLSDGGNIALTAADDTDNVAKWDNNTCDRTQATGLGAGDLSTIQPSDFEMVAGGTRYNAQNECCSRTPITN